MGSMNVFASGAWREAKGVHVFASGAWRKAKVVWTYVAGAWKPTPQVQQHTNRVTVGKWVNPTNNFEFYGMNIAKFATDKYGNITPETTQAGKLVRLSQQVKTGGGSLLGVSFEEPHPQVLLTVDDYAFIIPSTGASGATFFVDWPDSASYFKDRLGGIINVSAIPL